MKKKIICIIVVFVCMIFCVSCSNSNPQQLAALKEASTSETVETTTPIVTTTNQYITNTTVNTKRETTSKVSTTKKKQENKVSTTKKKQEKIPVCKIERFYTEGNISNKDKKIVINTLNNLPDEIIDSYNHHNWEFCVTDKSIAKNYYNGKPVGKVAGVTRYTKKIIYISPKVSAPHLKMTVLHEMSHYIDFQSGFTSNKTEFTKYYNEEKETFSRNVSGYSDNQISHLISSSREYYAGVCSAYLDGQNLQNMCPKSYNVVKNDICNL